MCIEIVLLCPTEVDRFTTFSGGFKWGLKWKCPESMSSMMIYKSGNSPLFPTFLSIPLFPTSNDVFSKCPKFSRNRMKVGISKSCNGMVMRSHLCWFVFKTLQTGDLHTLRRKKERPSFEISRFPNSSCLLILKYLQYSSMEVSWNRGTPKSILFSDFPL